MNKTAKTILLAVLAVVLIGGGVVVGMNWNNWFGQEKPAAAEVDDTAEDWTGNQGTYTGKKNTDTIDIPGFDTMNLKADVTEQSVNLYNPEQNTCYMKMTLLLSDGTKLWESKLIEPGKAVYDLTLAQTLSAGEYKDATLKYECYKMDEEQTPLNGSDIKLTINVME